METQNIYKRISAVAADVRSIEKDMSVGSGNYGYKAVSDLNVTKKVKESEKNNGIISIPVHQELVHHEIVKSQGPKGEKINYSFLIKMIVKIVNIDDPNDFIEIESFGHGLDNGDKGFGKASTYARKYALLNAYKIATGEDPDAEKSETQTGLPSPSDQKVAVQNYLMANTEAAKKMMQHFNVGNLDDISEDNYEMIYKQYKKKGIL